MTPSGIPPQQQRQGVKLAAALALACSLADTASAGVAVLPFAEALEMGEMKDQSGIHLAQTQVDRAREQALIGRLEEEIRRLNGRIEELEFEQRRTNNRLDQLVQDLENAPSAAAPERQDASPGQALSALEEQSSQRQQPAEGTLGSIPESAIAGLPRFDPADVAAPERDALTAEERYESAVQLLQAGNYQGAQNSLELFLEDYQDHQLASNAAYWLAESHYVRQNYSAAAAAFARNYRTYGKESPKAIDNLLKLGMSLSSLGESDKACLSYEELSSTFPNTPAHIQQAVNRERARAQCG